MNAFGRELYAQRVCHRLECVLRHCIGAEKGKRALARDGADDDDAAAGRSKRRQKCLGDGELSDDVHLELTPELLDGQVLER